MTISPLEVFVGARSRHQSERGARSLGVVYRDHRRGADGRSRRWLWWRGERKWIIDPVVVEILLQGEGNSRQRVRAESTRLTPELEGNEGERVVWEEWRLSCLSSFPSGSPLGSVGCNSLVTSLGIPKLETKS